MQGPPLACVTVTFSGLRIPSSLQALVCPSQPLLNPCSRWPCAHIPAHTPAHSLPGPSPALLTYLSPPWVTQHFFLICVLSSATIGTYIPHGKSVRRAWRAVAAPLWHARRWEGPRCSHEPPALPPAEVRPGLWTQAPPLLWCLAEMVLAARGVASQHCRHSKTETDGPSTGSLQRSTAGLGQAGSSHRAPSWPTGT